MSEEKDKGEPDWVFYHLCESNRYRVNPARVPVIGYQEVIQSLSRDDVFDYFKLTYIPNNMVFSVTGDLPAEEMLRAVQQIKPIAEEAGLTLPQFALAWVLLAATATPAARSASA